MRRVFVDTSAWYAFVNRKDPDHAAVAHALHARDVRFVTSTFVFDETITLCRRLGHGVARTAGDTLRNPAAVDLVRITGPDEDAAWKLHGERPDKVYSFTDCTSFVLMKRLGIDTAVALDDDFAQEGFTVIP